MHITHRHDGTAARTTCTGLTHCSGANLFIIFTSLSCVATLNFDIRFDAELDSIESSLYYGRVTRGDYSVALNLTGSAVDDPDVTLAENYSCKSERNYTKYCNPQVEKLIDEQSQEADLAKRKRLVWQIEKILAEDSARPMIQHGVAATCWHPHLKGHVLHENSIYNNWRFEGVWLDK